MILIANLVSPAAKTASGVDVFGLKLRKELFEDALTFKRRGWVTVIETTVISGNNFIIRLDHFGVDETLNGVTEDVGLVNRLHGRLGNFQHDRPVWAFLGLARLGLASIGEVLSWELDGLVWLVVWGIVGEDGGTVEGAVILREVEPALVSNSLRASASDTNTNNVSAGVKQTFT
jgi:hypothetical protein